MMKAYTLAVTQDGARYGAKLLLADPQIVRAKPWLRDLVADRSLWPRLLDFYLRHGIHPGPRPPPESDCRQNIEQMLAKIRVTP